MPGRTFEWAELTSDGFRGLDPERAIAVLPVAAIEQHGPHLPVMTDTAIAQGMLALLRERLPADLQVLVLPIQSIGKSNEHLALPGTLSLSAETLTRVLVETGESVRRAGLRKLILANSHGGNVAVLGVVARELRVRFDMLVVPTQWRAFGLPDKMYDAVESSHGIHAGDIETSLMLKFRPELVHMDKAKNFVSAGIAIEREFGKLTANKTHAFSWIAQDLNPEGALGNAAIGTADKGARTAEHQVEGFLDLVRDMTRFPLSRLHAPTALPSS